MDNSKIYFIPTREEKKTANYVLTDSYMTSFTSESTYLKQRSDLN